MIKHQESENSLLFQSEIFMQDPNNNLMKGEESPTIFGTIHNAQLMS